MNKLIFFFQSASAGGIILIIASVLGVILANSPVAGSYFAFLNFSFGGLSTLLWINDALMAIFFLLVGLEVKREMIDGQLNTNAKRLLPGLGAVCGFTVPALIFLFFNYSDSVHITGWAIPTATDIAFALGVLAMFGSRVPASLKAFLTALAVIDDLMAIIVIALFYSESIAVYYLLGAAVVLGILVYLNKRGVRKSFPYLILGAILWFCVLKSGLHATLAGVMLALTIPFSVLEGEHHYYPLVQWEHALHSWVTFLIIPIFGFANAGVSFGAFHWNDLLNPVVLGIALGLFIGKQIGVFGLVYGLVKTKVVPMPTGATWKHVYGVALLCGIGFTMSLFVAMLAFKEPEYLDYAKVGVFIGSIASAIVAAVVLSTCPKMEERID